MTTSWMKTLGLIALAGMLARPVAADELPSDDTPRLAMEEYVLSNGLRVVLQPDAGVPQVAVSLFVRVGSAHDPPRRSGFAHLFEHLVFLGSRHISKAVQDRLFLKIGSSDGASTWFDRTEYEMRGPSQHLETMLWLESDRLGFLTIADKGLASQREVVRQELRQNRESDPFWPADDRLRRLIFPPPHPYSRGVIGSHADLEQATVEDASRFYREHYVAANASLVVAGAFERDEARRLIAKYFGSLRKAPRPKAAIAPALTTGLVAQEQLTGPVPQKRISFAWLFPPGGDPRSGAGQLLASILGSGPGSVLVRDVIRGAKVAEDVKCEHWLLALGAYLKCDFFLGSPDRSTEQVLQAVRAALARLAEQGVEDADLRAAKMRWKVDHLRDLEAVRDRSILLNRYVALFGSADRLTEEWRRIDAIDRDAIKRMARDYLIEGRQAVVTVAPGTP